MSAPWKSSGESRRVVTQLPFTRDDIAELCHRAELLAELHSGWITMEPVPLDDHEPDNPAGVLGSFLTGARHEVPLCSWVPGHRGRNRLKPDAIGIQHASGTKAHLRLAEIGVPVPPGWRRVQDHPRRGLVLELPPKPDLFISLGWLVRAGEALSSEPLTGRWTARIHSSRS